MHVSEKNISLVGFMGAGKSAVAHALAQRLTREVFSSDDEIVRREDRPITDIFQTNGEPYFRRVEKAVIAELAAKKNIVIDCGGGAVLDPENLTQLRTNGIVVYLAASADTIYDRIKDATHRPLMDVPDPRKRIEELLEIRRAFYEQADYTVTTDKKSLQQVRDEIVEMVLMK